MRLALIYYFIATWQHIFLEIFAIDIIILCHLAPIHHYFLNLHIRYLLHKLLLQLLSLLWALYFNSYSINIFNSNIYCSNHLFLHHLNVCSIFSTFYLIKIIYYLFWATCCSNCLISVLLIHLSTFYYNHSTFILSGISFHQHIIYYFFKKYSYLSDQLINGLLLHFEHWPNHQDPLIFPILNLELLLHTHYFKLSPLPFLSFYLLASDQSSFFLIFLSAAVAE